MVATGCDEPSPIGADLVDAQGGQAVTTSASIDALRPALLRRPDSLESGSPQVPPRILAGRVDDPLLGVYDVQGYFRVTPITSDDFRSGTVETVELRLSRSYVYGDSTGAIEFALREVLEDWEAKGLEPGVSFQVGPILTQFTLQPGDTSATIPLPDDWVQRHEAALRNLDTNDSFHGFRLDPVSGSAVIGFGPTNATLFASTATDSLSFPMGQAYPHVARTTEAELPPHRFLMQAGSGPIPGFSAAMPDDGSLGDGPSRPGAFAVNRAAFTLWVDTTTMHASTPEHFVRPLLRTLDLFGISQEGTTLRLDRATMDDHGRFVFESSTLTQVVQNALLGLDTFEEFEIRIPDPGTTLATDESNHYYTSLNPVLFHDAGSSGDKAPTGFFTLTPLD